MHKSRIDPPISSLSKPPPRAPVTKILFKNGVRSMSRSRQRPDPQPQELSSQRSDDTADAQVNPNDDATRARIYKAEAYEAKVQVASQQKRIEALQAELEEVKLFQKMEHESNSRAREREKKIKDDAELIEALAQELETMEEDLKKSQMRVGELENGMMERDKSAKNRIAVQPAEIAQWRRKEADLTNQVERLQKELNNVRNDTDDLMNQKERQQKELIEARNETNEGVVIMRELDSALRAARAELDEARSQISSLRSEEEKQQEQMAVAKELEVALKSMQNERDEARTELSTLRDEMELSHSKCEGLELSNKELQKELESVQSESWTKMEQITKAVVEAQAREEQLTNEHLIMREIYDQKVKELEEMKIDLKGVGTQFEAQQKKLLDKASDMELLEEQHAASIASLKRQHLAELKEMEEKNKRAFSSLESKHAEELKERDEAADFRDSNWGNSLMDLRRELTSVQVKNQTLEAAEQKYVSEIGMLNQNLEAVEQKYMSEIAMLEDLLKHSSDDLRMDNAKLQAEKDDLLRKLQRGIEIHNKTKTELEAKTLELQSLTTAKQSEMEHIDHLKKDYSAAVTLSIERGRKIQLLEKDVETYKSQVTILAQKIKKIDRKAQASADASSEKLQSEVSSLQMKAKESEDIIAALKRDLLRSEEVKHDRELSEKCLQSELSSLQTKAKESESLISQLKRKAGLSEKRLQIEVCTLQTKARESEAMITSLKQELSSQSLETSQTEMLKRDLANTQEENEELQIKIRHLEEALKDMETALKAVNSFKKSARPESLSPTRREDKRKQIEDEALEEYCTQRLQTGK